MSELTPDGFKEVLSYMPELSSLRRYADAWQSDIEALNATAVSYLAAKEKLAERDKRIAELEAAVEWGLDQLIQAVPLGVEIDKDNPMMDAIRHKIITEKTPLINSSNFA